jgi:hypothetical protein
MPLNRRELLGMLGAGALATLSARSARATLVRGLSLSELVTRSERIVLGRALEHTAHYEEIGGSRRIVTDITLSVDDVLAKEAPAATLTLRVLGGVVGRQGEYVAGQPELELGGACALFLRALPSGIHWVTGMAQGHFPLRNDEHGEARLHASPHLPDMLEREHSAVRALVGRHVLEARALVMEALAR